MLLFQLLEIMDNHYLRGTYTIVYAYKKGIKTAFIFETEIAVYIYDFVKEGKEEKLKILMT